MSSLETAFPEDKHLQSRISAASSSDPNIAKLLHDITAYANLLQQEIKDLKRRLGDTNGNHTTAKESSSKKRKLQDTEGYQGSNGASLENTAWRTSEASFVVKEISFSVPLRKKLTLEIVGGDKARGSAGGIRAVNPSSGDVELGLAWSDVEQVICVPVPEKAQPSFNFVIIPTTSNAAPDGTSPEPIIWTVPATAPKNVTKGSVDGAESYEVLLKQVLDYELARVGKRVVCPDAKEFVSGIVQAHRKGEKAWHVKAFRGSKDGYLYFLSTGILFGFKKPVLFFPFSSVTSVSYSSILQRTFNLNIAASLNGGETQEFEFGMLDQADYEGVNRYVRGHQLHDASLAAERKAKKLNVNGVKKEAAGDEGVDGGKEEEADEEGELAKAERAMQDAEDEEEEDYDPGSEGESEGSGTEDEEDDGDGQGGGQADEVEEEVYDEDEDD